MQEAKISIDVHTRKLQSLVYRFVDQTGYRHIFQLKGVKVGISCEKEIVNAKGDIHGACAV